ncbi:MAG: hypothetical protein ABIL12_00700 [candidate division WOR-3 bacterium]
MMWIVLLSQKPAVEPIGVKDSTVKDVYDKGEIDWTHGCIRAKGYGFIDPNKPKGQAKLLAERAAVVDARRNLLEIVKGVHITSETVVEDYMVSSDIVVQRVEGLVKDAKVIGKPKYYEDGRVEVWVEMKLDNLAKTLPTKPSVSEPQEKPEEGGVIIKTPEGTKACMYPRILDENGNVLFDASQYPEAKDMWSKAIKYVKGKVSTLPGGSMVIEASETKGCDIIVKKEDLDKVSKLKKWGSYILKAGKLIINLVM